MVSVILASLPLSLLFVAADSYNMFFLAIGLVIQVLGLILYARFHNRCRSWEGFGLFLLGSGMALFLFFYMMKRAAQSVVSNIGTAFVTFRHDIVVRMQVYAMNTYRASLQSANTGKVWSWDAQSRRLVLVPADTVSTTDPILFLETSMPQDNNQIVFLLAKQYNRQSFTTTTLGYVVEQTGYMTVLQDNTNPPGSLAGATFAIGRMGTSEKTAFELFSADSNGNPQRAIREGDAGQLESSLDANSVTMWNIWAIPTASLVY